MRDHLELSEEQAEALLSAMAETDAKNAAMGVSGQEVAQYNLRVLKLQSLRQHLKHAEAEHAAHPVTRKIAAWHAQEKAQGAAAEEC